MMKIPDISTHDGRRGWAFIATLGGCMVFTAIIIASLWMIRGNAGFVFWLALAAHIQVFMGMGAMGWAMGRRMQSSVTRDGANFDDRELK
mgnify:CR=1 FL=1